MANHMRCPGCHLRLSPTLKLLVERAKLEWRQEQEKAGVRFTGRTDDAQSFPCHRCGEPIAREALVRGDYDERLPPVVLLEAPLAGIAVGCLFGVLYGWGVVAGAAAGLLGAVLSVAMLVPLQHNRRENRMLAARGLPPSRADWSEAIAFAAILLLMPGLATLLYRTIGWTGLVGTTVVGIALLAFIFFRGERPGSRSSQEPAAEPGPQSLDSQPQRHGEAEKTA